MRFFKSWRRRQIARNLLLASIERRNKRYALARYYVTLAKGLREVSNP